MALNATNKAEIIKDYQLEDGDTGSPEVQVALLTHNINGLKVTFVIITKITIHGVV